jgi:hypothetical protein
MRVRHAKARIKEFGVESESKRELRRYGSGRSNGCLKETGELFLPTQAGELAFSGIHEKWEWGQKDLHEEWERSKNQDDGRGEQGKVYSDGEGDCEEEVGMSTCQKSLGAQLEAMFDGIFFKGVKECFNKMWYKGLKYKLSWGMNTEDFGMNDK